MAASLPAPTATSQRTISRIRKRFIIGQWPCPWSVVCRLSALVEFRFANGDDIRCFGNGKSVAFGIAANGLFDRRPNGVEFWGCLPLQQSGGAHTGVSFRIEWIT